MDGHGGETSAVALRGALRAHLRVTAIFILRGVQAL
jgi:hypothetical protein